MFTVSVAYIFTDSAVADGLGKCYVNSGQTCSALTRMLVPRDRLAQAEAGADARGEPRVAFVPRQLSPARLMLGDNSRRDA